MYADSQVRRYLGGEVSREDFEGKFAKMLDVEAPEFHLVVRDLDSDVFMGLVSFDRYHDGERFELSYQFLPEYWGQGIADEVLKAVIDDVFSRDLCDELVSKTQEANAASIRLLEKLGMEPYEKLERHGTAQVVYRLYSSSKYCIRQALPVCGSISTLLRRRSHGSR